MLLFTLFHTESAYASTECRGCHPEADWSRERWRLSVYFKYWCQNKCRHSCIEKPAKGKLMFYPIVLLQQICKKCSIQVFSANLVPLQSMVEDVNDQASDFTTNSITLSSQILSRLEDINTRWVWVSYAWWYDVAITHSTIGDCIFKPKGLDLKRKIAAARRKTKP